MNLYQPTITGSLSVSGSVNISGSISIAGGGTISGTASIATTALTASSADNLLVRNTLTAQTLVVQTITSSVDFVTGSTRFGSLAANTHIFTGSMSISGSSVRISGNQVDYILNSTSSTQYSRISFEESGSDKAQLQYINSGFSSGNRAGRLEIANAASGGQGISFISAVSSFNTPQMFISSSGNVGIGTTTPIAPLTINVPAVGSSISATTSQQAFDYSRFRIKHYTDSNLGLSIGYAGANYTYIQACYNEGSTAPLLLNPFNGSVGIGTTSPLSAALTIHASGSGAGNAGNQIWIRGGNTNVTNNSNTVVLSYGTGDLYSHAIKTTHNSAAINGNAIDFYVWNYGTDSSSTIGTRKIMSVDGVGVLKPVQPAFGIYRSNSSFTITNSSDTVLPYNSVFYDTASNFNTSQYRFYAPVAGKYVFSANVRYDAPSGTYLRTYFTINGSSGTPVSFLYGMQISGAGGYSANYQSHNISTILNLAAGDWVDVRGGINSGTVTMHQESSFFGYLLG
jgi:hypothetical protein